MAVEGDAVAEQLERLLLEAEFDAAIIERARKLIAQLVNRGVTKYNLGAPGHSIEWPAGFRGWVCAAAIHVRKTKMRAYFFMRDTD